MLYREPRRTGLTLIEVLVALVVTGAVVLTGRGIADQLAQSSRMTTTAIDARLTEISKAHELRRMFRLAAAPLDSTSAFNGGLDRVVFTTRCTVPRGWDEPCRCLVYVERTRQPVALQRNCSGSSTTDTLAEDATGITLHYLIDATRGGQWLKDWGRSSNLPTAIGVVRFTHADTLIVRIGPRG